MRREMSGAPADLADGDLARGEPRTGGRLGTPAQAGNLSAARDGRKSRAAVVRAKERQGRQWRRFTSRTPRRLGPVEFTLLALITLGVAITLLMAIVNP